MPASTPSVEQDRLGDVSKSATDEPTRPAVSALPVWGTLILFAVPTVLMWLATRLGIPWLRERLHGPDILCWFVAGGAVFVILFLASFVAFWIEKGSVTLAGFAAHFRFRRVGLGDVLYPVAALAVCGAASGLIFLAWTGIAASTGLLDAPDLSPPFVHIEPLTAGTLWVLAAWLPLFVFNITGEELWWRGYMLPRQERQHGKWAWLVHGAGLTLFHLPLGVDLAIILLPLLGALPWVVQRRQNLWCGFIFHGLLNGGGFLAVAFGLA